MKSERDFPWALAALSIRERVSLRTRRFTACVLMSLFEASGISTFPFPRLLRHYSTHRYTLCICAQIWSQKVGEAHTAVELVSRGVRGHLRGQVNQCIDFLLQRGILRNKPTLKGLHTSIEPKYVPAVTRFIEEGTPPLPELEPLLVV